jgi:hypothetical protein
LTESGLFNGLHKKKRKKISRPLTRVSGCGQTPETQIFLSFSSRPAAFRKNAEVRLREWESYSTNLVFRKPFARTFFLAGRLRPTLGSRMRPSGSPTRAWRTRRPRGLIIVSELKQAVAPRGTSEAPERRGARRTVKGACEDPAHRGWRVQVSNPISSTGFDAQPTALVHSHSAFVRRHV